MPASGFRVVLRLVRWVLVPLLALLLALHLQDIVKFVGDISSLVSRDLPRDSAPSNRRTPITAEMLNDRASGSGISMDGVYRSAAEGLYSSAQHPIPQSRPQLERTTSPRELADQWKSVPFNMLFQSNTGRDPKANEGTWLMRREFHDLVVNYNLNELPNDGLLNDTHGGPLRFDGDWMDKHLRDSVESVNAYFVDLATTILWVSDPTAPLRYWWTGMPITDRTVRHILYGHDFALDGPISMPSLEVLWRGPYDSDDFMSRDRRIFDPMNVSSDFVRKNMRPPVELHRRYLKLAGSALHAIRKECAAMGRRDLLKRIDEGRRLCAHARAQIHRQSRLVMFSEVALDYIDKEMEEVREDEWNFIHVSRGNGPLDGLSTEELLKGYQWIKEQGEVRRQRHRYLQWVKAQRTFEKEEQLRALLHEILSELRQEGRLVNNSDVDAGLVLFNSRQQ